jgi:mono/diheme cytochrome c family protein
MRRLCGRVLVHPLLLVCLLASGVLLAGTGRRAAAGPLKWDDIRNPYEGDAQAVDEGRELFVERCTFCHGTLGRGAKGPCLSCGHYYYRGGSNAQLFATITAGIQGGQMGAFASSLTGEQIWKIIAFLRAQTRQDHPEAFSQD